ncbi:hypothetical protein KVR01_007000 [Diaporthe batatas]|uniref:uncharacterized protein n=1 Tax=Diaporthe batatas TaxID=748121 RepID=UPI001D041CF1|nr:uncharacterized protein KVR01_007000 [Diaporthe batatas]KAG8163703.1 hypothetical protein KVR01_007000 [Diaporthe batatas]
MSLLTDLPPELRQHIIRLIPGSMPDEIQLSHTGWPDPVKQLLATCKVLRADTIYLMSTWSFDCLVPRSGYIDHVSRLSRAIEALGLNNRVRKVRLLIFAEITLAYPREPGNIEWRHVGTLRRIMRKWEERCSNLPRGDIQTVVVDITPLPRKMLESHPNLVHANLVDARTVSFFNDRWAPVSHIMTCLNKHFNPAPFELTPVVLVWAKDEDGEDKVVLAEEPPYMPLSVKVAIGGQIGEGSRSDIESLRYHGGISVTLIKNGTADFIGTYCDGEMPEHLSLHRLVQRCGIQLATDESETDYEVNVSGITLLEDAEENEVAPAKDFSALSPMHLSKHSATAFYKIALENEEAARGMVVKLLTFAADCRQSLDNLPHLDFLPATPLRDGLVRELCRDLGLLCNSIKGKYGKFQRVSSLGHELNSRLNGIRGRNCEPLMEALSISHTVDPGANKD